MSQEPEKHCRVQEIPLTDEQRKLLSVTRDVVIPGAKEEPEPVPAPGVMGTLKENDRA